MRNQSSESSELESEVRQEIMLEPYSKTPATTLIPDAVKATGYEIVATKAKKWRYSLSALP